MIRKKGKSLCIFSAKGGVGKTITTLNLAGIFKLIEKKVLIMDMDLANGGVTVALNCPFTSTIYNFVDDYNNNRYQVLKILVKKAKLIPNILKLP